MLRENPEEWYAGFAADYPGVDRRVLEWPKVRAIAIEMLQEEAVRRGAADWLDDVLRLVRPWPFRLEEIGGEVVFHHGEDDTAAAREGARREDTGKPAAPVPGRGTYLYAR